MLSWVEQKKKFYNLQDKLPYILLEQHWFKFWVHKLCSAKEQLLDNAGISRYGEHLIGIPQQFLSQSMVWHLIRIVLMKQF